MLDRRASARGVRLLPAFAVALAIAFGSGTASAYPWMIRHEYQGCVPCHADPSGAGLLTAYGRAMGENVLRTRYGSKPPDEPPIYARFLFGVPEPDWLLAGGSLRAAYLINTTPGTPVSEQLILMEADLKAQVTLWRFRASGSLGYMQLGAQTYQLTDNAQNNLVSREHWVGVDLGEDKQALLRAGRIDVPFGIRDDNHQLFVRSSMVTQTNINDSAEYGVAVSYSGQAVRGEVMAVLGNYQISPDAFRQRGYAGFVEFVVAPKVSVGASSLVDFAKQDYLSDTMGAALFNTVRQVHGAFARLSPARPLVLLVEADATIITGKPGATTAPSTTAPGFAGLIEADIEPVQGLHFIPAVETWIQGDYSTTGTGATTTGRSFSGWAGVLWFFAPHADARVDFVATSVLDSPVQYYLLPQLHLYL